MKKPILTAPAFSAWVILRKNVGPDKRSHQAFQRRMAARLIRLQEYPAYELVLL
ncbi:hypothetical protein KCP78_12770 [Salmonella enterica subsp. enterica]|nr:hypothetical protein KCP78_12770 [Salmonella enterica subsp. enterica]